MDDTGLIDSHAHVWDLTCQVVRGARYHPHYEATVETYLGVLDAHGIERAVLVQPSFLGSDNVYLLGALRAYPDRLRGIVVIDPGISDAEMDDLTALGVIGHRYNLLSMDTGLIARDDHRSLSARATMRKWWTEVQAPGPVWPALVETFAEDGTFVMVDHFGLPSGRDCPGIAALRTLGNGCVSLKLSAPYRQMTADYVQAVSGWLASQDAPDLLWGSDWPWTQHEGKHSYRDCLDWLDRWNDPTWTASVRGNEHPLGFARR